MKIVSRRVSLFAVLVLAAAWSTAAQAHFLWLKSEDAEDGKPQAVLIFGESAADEAYHLPESLADTELFVRTPAGKREALKTEKVDTDDRVGLVAPLPNAELPEVIETSREYGVYGDFLLTYYAKHIRAKANDQLAAAGPSKGLKLDIVPQATDDGLELTVLWDGKPKEGVDVSVKVDGENEDVDPEKLKTDANGKVTVRPADSGLVAVLANVHDGKQSGELKGKKYTSAAHYASLTFPWVHNDKAAAKKPEKAAKNDSGIAPLPEAVSSFGAAVADGYLYVYSGHTGTEHDHSAANLSKRFIRVPLAGGEWEELPMDTPLQGLPLVAHGGKLYRVGGLSARNATTDDEEDLHSSTEFSQYDPATKNWTALEPLPAGRSSHNAVVIGDKLYVVGGWTLSGSRKGDWLDDSLVYDFSDPSAGWQKLPAQNFKRRALAASQWKGKLVALGGMDEQAKISRSVDFFDPASGKWSQGPKLPGTGMSGFGVSAWNLGDKLYVSGFNGRVFKLADDGSKWEVVAKLEEPRFFHQLVPAAQDNALLVVGGASRDGHLTSIELIDVSDEAVKKAKKAAATADDSDQASDGGAYHHGRGKSFHESHGGGAHPHASAQARAHAG